MGIKGRVTFMLLYITIHTSYIIYYLVRENRVDIADLLGYPIVLVVTYWSGLQYDKAKFYAEKDALTSLYNRRYMLENFARLREAANKKGKRLYIMVIDCDNFKQVNDTLGHATGDAVLKLIARALTNNIRKLDVPARWGGDEFIVVGQIDGAAYVHSLIDGLSEEMNGISENIRFSVSVSVGYAIYPEDSMEFASLLKKADDHMYENKASKKIRENTHRIVPCTFYENN